MEFDIISNKEKNEEMWRSKTTSYSTYRICMWNKPGKRAEENLQWGALKLQKQPYSPVFVYQQSGSKAFTWPDGDYQKNAHWAENYQLS